MIRILLIIFSLASINIMASNFSLRTAKINLPLNKSRWQTAKDFSGNPLSLFGPIENKLRPVLIFSDTPLKESLDKELQRETSNKFYSERKIWMKANKAIFEKEIPYKQYQNQKKIDFYEVGLVYKLNKQRYTEKSLFFVCNKQLINVSLLIPHTKSFKQNTSEIKNLIQNISCH